MSYPDCPKCGAAVLQLHVERIIREYRERAGYNVQVPSSPAGYNFQPCGHRLVLQGDVEGYTAAGLALIATRNSDNLTP